MLTDFFNDQTGGVYGQHCSTVHNDAGLTLAKVPHAMAESPGRKAEGPFRAHGLHSFRGIWVLSKCIMRNHVLGIATFDPIFLSI